MAKIRGELFAVKPKGKNRDATCAHKLNFVLFVQKCKRKSDFGNTIKLMKGQRWGCSFWMRNKVKIDMII
jgi:hypothetical protein